LWHIGFLNTGLTSL